MFTFYQMVIEEFQNMAIYNANIYGYSGVDKFLSRRPKNRARKK